MALPPPRAGDMLANLYSSSLFIAGSSIRVPQAEAKPLYAIHCTAASPGEAKGGIKNVLSSQYVQISLTMEVL